MSRRLTTLLLSLCAGTFSLACAGEIEINFEQAEIGKPTPTWVDKGVEFKLAGPLAHSKAVGRVMFFPHLETEKNGILNAMANEQSIPVKVTFPEPVKEVTLVLWGSIASPALVEARDKDDKLLDTAKVEKVPERKSPADPIPSFELTVKGENIAYVLYGGAPTGSFVAAEEVRYTPMKVEAAPAK